MGAFIGCSPVELQIRGVNDSGGLWIRRSEGCLGAWLLPFIDYPADGYGWLFPPHQQ